MTELRRATAPAHARLEQRLDVVTRLQTSAGYRSLLEAFYGFYAPLEQRLAPRALTIAGLEFAARRKTPLLETDLVRLGSNPAALPTAPADPPADDVMAVLGVLYVLEGATLGGKVIGRQARRALGVTPALGGAFLGAYGDQIGARWRRFGAIVDALAPSGAPPQMLAAAVWCFASLEEWLCP